MTRKEMKDWNAKAQAGTVKDELNPAFILSLTATELLSKIAKGEINLQELAKKLFGSARKTKINKPY